MEIISNLTDTNLESKSQLSSKANITIFISMVSYLRNWIGAGAFEQLEKTYNVTYLIPEYDWNPNDITNFTSCKYVVIKQAKWRRNILRRFLTVSMVSASKRSEAFRIKISYMRLRSRLAFSVFKLDIFFNVLSNLLVWLMPKWEELSEYISESKPDLFIAPSLLADSFTMDLALTAKKSCVKTIILVNSWDNLISKGTLPYELDSLAVWGVSSIKHAQYVQRIGIDKISVLGVPRFDCYFNGNLISGLNSSDKDYIYACNCIEKSKKIILYPATSLPFDDIQALALLDRAISTNQKLVDYVVLYRPHPETFPRLKEKNFFDQKFKNVVMDQQMVSYYRTRFGINEGAHVPSAINITDLEYYPKLLRSIYSVVCPATTMALEALLLGKSVVMICYDDGVNKWFPPSEICRYENVRELMSLPGVVVCDEETSLASSLFLSIEMTEQPNISQLISDSTQGIVYRDSDSYSVRLLHLVNKLLSSETKLSHQF